MAGDGIFMLGVNSSHEDESKSLNVINYIEIDTAEAAQDLLARSSCDASGVLCLQNYSLALPAVTAIGEAFCSKTNLKNVIMDNVFSGRPINDIPKSMTLMLLALAKSKCTIQYLDISYNRLGFKGIFGLLSLLRSVRCFSLSSLRIECIELNYIGAKELAKVLELQRRRHKRNKTRCPFTSCKVGYNCIKDVGLVALSKVFTQMGTLEEICVQENNITSYGVSQLAKCFSENLQLKVLCLSKNPLMYEGAECLSNTLHYLPELRELDLSDCALGWRGGCELANVLSNLTYLQRLNLSRNDFTFLAGEKIIQMLSSCPGVSLDLNENKFGRTGVYVLQCMAEARSIGLQSLEDDLGSTKHPAIFDDYCDELNRECKRPRLE